MKNPLMISYMLLTKTFRTTYNQSASFTQI